MVNYIMRRQFGRKPPGRRFGGVTRVDDPIVATALTNADFDVRDMADCLLLYLGMGGICSAHVESGWKHPQQKGRILLNVPKNQDLVVPKWYMGFEVVPRIIDATR